MVNNMFISDFILAISCGLSGSTHCLGMCGGIVSAFERSLPQDIYLYRKLPFLFLYNIGRISSYLFVTLCCTYGLSNLNDMLYIKNWFTFLEVFAGLLLISMGIYIVSNFKLMHSLEKIGVPLWQLILPMRKKIYPINTLLKSYLAGCIWGWLPCGLVYTMLSWAISTGNIEKAMTIMLGFGIGTLPSMIGTGILAERFIYVYQKYQLKFISGAMIITYGCYTLYSPIIKFI